MPSAVEIFLILLATSESLLGVLGNGFIGLVNCFDCVKRKKFSLICFILTGLAISRMCVIWVMILDGYTSVLSPDMDTFGNFIDYISYLWAIFSHLDTSFATSLSIFYLLKIANFSHSIFLWLKRRINTVFILLMGCIILSFILHFQEVIKIINDHKMKYRNTSWQLYERNRELVIGHICLNLGVIFFFMVNVVTCFLLIFSLWRHHRQMQSSVTGFRDISTEAHVKAMKVLISFIILYGLHFIGIIIGMSCAIVIGNKPLYIFGLITAAVCPYAHPFVLILGNSQLKQTSLKVMQRLKCCEKRQILRVT